MGRTCDYSDVPASPSPEDFQYLRQKVQELEEKLQSRSRNTSVPRSITLSDDNGMGGVPIGINPNPASLYAPLLFLDSDAYDYGKFTIPKPRMLVPPEILDALGDIGELRAIIDTYFLTVHTWMPIVSKKRLYQQLMNPLVEQNADFGLLYLCMKLVIQRPPEPPASVQTPLYSIAKRFYFLVETGGIYSLTLLQSGVLISLYELGHAVYPAAYLSIGQCARLGHALGIHGKNAPQMLHKVGTWTELEERRRVWWAVVILERYTSLPLNTSPSRTTQPPP
jgi:Fungal specific transcription factor domain